MVSALSERRIFDLLTEIVGPENSSLSAADLTAYRYDIGPYLGKTPMCIIRPHSTDEVAEILRVANRYSIPVVPRSGGTNYAGLSLSWQGGIVLDLNGMNRIIQVDPVTQVGIVETGVTWTQYNMECKKYGLEAGPIPEAGPMSCVGGAVGHNGGGHMTHRYLTAAYQRDFVLAIEVVLPTGEIVKTGSWAAGCPPIENALGPDLMGLFVGACGTLGVITQIAHKLRVLPKARGYYLYGFPDLATCVKGSWEALQDHNTGCLMWMDYWAMKVFANRDFSAWNAMLDIEGDSEEVVAYHERIVKQKMAELGAVDYGPDFVRLWFEYPTEAWLTLMRHGLWHGPTNIAIHPNRTQEFWDVWERACKRHNWPIERSFGFGSLVRGGAAVYLQPIMLYLDEDPKERAEAIRIADEVVEEWVRMGCAPYDGGGKVYNYTAFWSKLGPYYELMKRIKRMLDPNNIMNPGIIFP